MKTKADKIRFAVTLVGTDLSSLRPGDWMNLEDDLHIFLFDDECGGLVAAPLSKPLPKNCTEEDFRVLQNNFNTVFDNSNATLPLHFDAGFILMTISNNNVLQVIAPTQKAAMLILVTLMSGEPADRVLRCPECNKYFYRVRKQVYCSRTCVNRVTVREWRQAKRDEIPDELRVPKPPPSADISNCKKGGT